MSMISGYIRKGALVALTAMILSFGVVAVGGVSVMTAEPAAAQQQGTVPGNALGNTSDADLWKRIRRGEGGMIGSDGDNWRAIKNGPLSTYGAWAMAGIIIALTIFLLIRGRIRIEHGPDPQGRTIERFNALERAVHWLTATSFIVLALTGLNVLYGRYIIKPVLGDSMFGALTYYGKIAHNYIAFAFIVGIALMLILWIKDNIPSGRDLKWLAMGGGMFSKGVHPEAPRFNAGQKIIFWAVILGGASLSFSGIALMWPGEVQPWAGTFGILNNLGLDLPTTLTANNEQQLSVLWHSAVALLMIVIIIAHIYIGTIGMEGAFDAVNSGEVDLNWAKEHHSLWVEEEMSKSQGKQQPAE